MTRLLLAVAAGFVLAFGVMGVGALAVLEFGLYDVRATTPHPLPVAWAVHKAMEHSERLRSGGISPPARFTPAQVEAGFVDYDNHCTMCHGGPGVPRAVFVSGMTPSPPYVIDSGRRWSTAELYEILNNGVKMTAMPAWGHTLGHARVWNLVAFLKALPYLSARDYAALRASHAAQARPIPATNG